MKISLNRLFSNGTGAALGSVAFALALIIPTLAHADNDADSSPAGAADVAPADAPADATPAAETPAATTDTDETASELPPRLPLDELRLFAQAFHRVSSAYVEDIDDKALLENAIRGMLSQLDPHSAYLDKDSFSDLQESTTGNYGGLGLEVGMEDGLIRVITPMDDTPADLAGVRAGDLIIRLDEQPVKGMSLGEAIETMRGAPGSSVTITLVREGEQPQEVTLQREIIKVASVRHRYLEDGYGYIRIAQFQNRTGAEVVEALVALNDEQPLTGLVLDLRNNPGGVLQAAVEVSDAFLDGGGLIVYTEGRLEHADLRYSATARDASDGVPVVVLVNEGTASASEIVAGALQDHGRAVIMGTTTFGKGSVQTILPLDDEKAIKLTTALYYTPQGRSIQASGIAPDIAVRRSKVTPLDKSPFRVQERDLPKHLDSVDEEVNETPESEAPEPVKDLVEQDYQLHEALTLLKGLNILAQKSKQPKG